MTSPLLVDGNTLTLEDVIDVARHARSVVLRDDARERMAAFARLGRSRSGDRAADGVRHQHRLRHLCGPPHPDRSSRSPEPQFDHQPCHRHRRAVSRRSGARCDADPRQHAGDRPFRHPARNRLDLPDENKALSGGNFHGEWRWPDPPPRRSRHQRTRARLLTSDSSDPPIHFRLSKPREMHESFATRHHFRLRRRPG